MHRCWAPILLLILSTSALAFSVGSSQDEENTDIFIVAADGSGRRNLTNDHVYGDDYPALSPDGRTLAFARGRNLFVMPARGGRARELLPSATKPTWSPDGANLAFNRVAADNRGYEAGIVRRDGSGVISIPDAWNPTWLDGKRIAFETEKGDWTYAIAVAKADGSERRVVVRGEDLGLLEVFGPMAAPNGRSIAFTGGNPTPREAARVYSMNLTAGSQPRLISRGWGESPSWSPTGRRVVLVGADEGGISTVRADGTQRRLFPATRRRYPQLPSWSPDGTRIAFIAHHSRSRHDLVVMNVRHRSLRVVARRVERSQPVWSRDSRRLYYVAKSGS